MSCLGVFDTCEQPSQCARLALGPAVAINQSLRSTCVQAFYWLTSRHSDFSSQTNPNGGKRCRLACRSLVLSQLRISTWENHFMGRGVGEEIH